MDYAKTRKILIIFLLIVNLFLVSYAFVVSGEQNRQNNELISENIKTLNSHGIYIDKDVYETANKPQKSYKFDSYITKDIIVNLLGEVKSSENNLYVSENGTANIINDRFIISLNKKHTFDEIDNLLKNAGFDTVNADVKIQDNKATYTYKIDDYYVFNCKFEVILNSNDTLIEGTYIFAKDGLGQNVEQYNLLQILVKLDQISDISGEILDIKLAYKLENSLSFDIIPIYEIVLSDKSILYDIYNEKLLN